MAFSLRYAITTSPATLPTAAVVGSAIWLLGGLGEASRWAAWGITLLTMLAIMDWNSRATLIRQRTRMASTSFIVLLTAFAFLETWHQSMIAALCYVLTQIVLSYCYQDHKSQGKVYHAFMLLGIGTLFFRPLVWLTPLLLFSMAIHLRALTWRTGSAAILGLLTPYWLIVAWCAVRGEWSTQLLWTEGDMSWEWLHPNALDGKRIASLLFLFAYVLIALIDYVRTYYQDKIRTRMFIYSIMVQLVGLTLMMFPFGGDFDSILRLMCVCAAPLIGHHLSLARGRLVNWYFMLTLALILYLIIFTRLS